MGSKLGRHREDDTDRNQDESSKRRSLGGEFSQHSGVKWPIAWVWEAIEAWE